MFVRWLLSRFCGSNDTHQLLCWKTVHSTFTWGIRCSKATVTGTDEVQGEKRKKSNSEDRREKRGKRRYSDCTWGKWREKGPSGTPLTHRITDRRLDQSALVPRAGNAGNTAAIVPGFLEGLAFNILIRTHASHSKESM